MLESFSLRAIERSLKDVKGWMHEVLDAPSSARSAVDSYNDPWVCLNDLMDWVMESHTEITSTVRWFEQMIARHRAARHRTGADVGLRNRPTSYRSCSDTFRQLLYMHRNVAECKERCDALKTECELIIMATQIEVPDDNHDAMIQFFLRSYRQHGRLRDARQ